MGAPDSIDGYIAGFDAETRARLEELRSIINTAVPEAIAKISYQIPAFTLEGKIIVSIAAFKTHIGLYPAPVGHPDFADLAPYASGKATARFALDEPFPTVLIEKILSHRIAGLKSGAAKRPAKATRQGGRLN